MDINGHVTNVGNIFYAAATCAQVVLLAQQGPDWALLSIKRVNVLLIGVFMLGAGLERMPVLPGNELFMDAMRTIVHHSLGVVTASFAAFFLSQAVLIRSWTRLSAHHGPVVAGVLASCLCQAVDSPVFFAIAFWDQMPLAQLADAASTGFLLKSALAVAFVPAFCSPHTRG